MSAFNLAHLSISTRRKLASILLAIVIFAFLAGLTTLAVGRPLAFGVIVAILVGLGVGLFEEFYVQTLRGRWLRRMHLFGLISVYIGVLVTFFLITIHLSHLMLGRLDDLPFVYRRLPFAIPAFVVFSVIGGLSISSASRTCFIRLSAPITARCRMRRC